MIVCGWCDAATEADACANCGRDPRLPWEQRAMQPPKARANHAPGRPALDPGQIKHKVRLAFKELGEGATNAQLAEQLGVAESTVRNWRKVSGL